MLCSTAVIGNGDGVGNLVSSNQVDATLVNDDGQ